MQQWLVLDGTVSASWVSEVEGLLDSYSLVVMENQKRLRTTSKLKYYFFANFNFKNMVIFMILVFNFI